MSANEIREKFITYFQEHHHLQMESSSLIPIEPTLLLTNSGMVQMIPFLLAQKTPPSPRVCSVQKCFRTTDIDSIGEDGRHLTFFEMLGSWSFGDYYKKEAIALAYELLTDVFHFDKDRLWVTVFKGERGIPRDEESIAHWEAVGIPRERIIALGWSDNFWPPPGDEGPCGPSTEIYYDMLGDGSKKFTHMKAEDVYTDTQTACGPGCDCDRFLEIWNAGVFTEYYKDKEGNFSQLSQKNVDTGAGLERMAAFLQGKKEVFHTDTLYPIYQFVQDRLHIGRSADEETSIRIITDHVRGSVFLIADGVRPSNEGRGYILRKVIRRALVHIYKYDQLFALQSIVPIVAEIYRKAYPYIQEKTEEIQGVLSQEQQKYRALLDRAQPLVEKMLQKGTISGADIFTLSDTHGVPIEVTRDILTNKGLVFDEEGYLQKLEEQKARSRQGSKFSSERKK